MWDGMTDEEMERELQFLIDNPYFEERPATVSEFLGDRYLNIASGVRPSILEALEEIIGTEINPQKMTVYDKAMMTGGIGIGKTTIASIVLPYMAHWTLCLRNPQEFYGLLPGSRIAFMQMSTSGPQAKEVVFGDIKARIQYCKWFMEKYPYEKDFKNQLRFSKDIWILPGDSAETTFEGYNILGGILDEADSHKVTKEKDYAEQGYTTITSRIASRFGDRGFVLVIGQMKKANGFAAKKYREFRADPACYTSRMAIWESLGWHRFVDPATGERDSFWYNVKRKEIIPKGVIDVVGVGEHSDEYIEIPTLYRPEFESHPEKALRDLAGIPPAVGSPFISLTYRVEEAQERYMQSFGMKSPVGSNGQILPPAVWKARDSLPRVCHIDMAYSGDGDALGFAMGHVRGVEEVDGELKPYIVIDLAMRIKAPAGREIFIGDVRRMIYELRREYKFKIVKVTTDGFESTDTRQQLEKRRIATDKVSMDRSLVPYHDLRDAIYEKRIELPTLMAMYHPDDDNPTNIIYKELTELEDNGPKIDHPFEGSKDVADAVGGVVYTLMDDRTFHRGVKRLSVSDPRQQETYTGPKINTLDGGLIGGLGLSAPLPPSSGPMSWRPPKGRL